MELWRQCTHWLIQCRVLPPSHRVTWDGAQVCELAQALRDGVLLCQLLNNLLPHAINLREVNLRPQMSQVRRVCRRVGGGRHRRLVPRRVMHCPSGPAVKRGGWPPLWAWHGGYVGVLTLKIQGWPPQGQQEWIPTSRLKTGKLGVNPSPKPQADSARDLDPKRDLLGVRRGP